MSDMLRLQRASRAYIDRIRDGSTPEEAMRNTRQEFDLHETEEEDVVWLMRVPDRLFHLALLLGRPLTHAERTSAATIDDLTDTHKAVVRALAARQLVLCGLYLRTICTQQPSISTVMAYMEKLLEVAVHPMLTDTIK